MHIFTHIISTFICCLLLAKVLNLDYVVHPLNFEQPNLTPDTVHNGTWSALISNQQISKSDLNNISLINFSKRNRTIKHDRLLLTYLYNLLLLNSYAPEPNPGPAAKYPCGSCNKAVTWKHKAVVCDTCETWFHIDCQGLDDYMHNILNSSNLSWECINCGMPNFFTTFFNSTSIESTNSYSFLDSDIQSPINIGHPTFSSSPINTQKSGQSVNSKFKQNRNHQKPLRVLNINFQSLKNKNLN